MSLGNNIKAIRNMRGMTISQLSYVTGVSRSTITDIESDAGRKPNTVTLEKFAKALSVSMDDFFKEGDLTSIKEEIPQGYLRIVKEAQKKGISPEDIAIAMDFFVRARQNDEKAKRDTNK